MKWSDTNSLAVEIAETPDQAQKYERPEYRYASLDKVVIVRNGTKNSNDTVDLIFTDPETGQKYIAMVTARLLKQVTDVTITNRN